MNGKVVEVKAQNPSLLSLSNLTEQWRLMLLQQRQIQLQEHQIEVMERKFEMLYQCLR